MYPFISLDMLANRLGAPLMPASDVAVLAAPRVLLVQTRIKLRTFICLSIDEVVWYSLFDFMSASLL